MYNSVTHKYTLIEYTTDDSYNIDSYIWQFNINNGNNDFNPEFNINNINTEYSLENGQTDQLNIFNYALARRPRLNWYRWTQLSIKDRNIWDLLDDADKNIIPSVASFINTSNNKQEYQPHGNIPN